MKYMDFTASSAAEEFAILVGRVEAFAAFVNASKYNIERELCAKMLGFVLHDATQQPQVEKEGER